MVAYTKKASMDTSDFGELLLELVQPQVAPKTFETYVNAFRKWKEIMGETVLEEISPQSIEMFKAKCLSSGLAPETTSVYFRSLKTLFNKALEMGMLTGTNPFSDAKSVKVPIKPPQWITEDDHKLLLKILKGNGRKGTETARRLFTFLFHTGLRSGECLSLRIEDIDLENKTILVHSSKTNTVRGVPLNSDALFVLKRQIEVYELKSGRIWNNTVNGASQAFRKAKKRAGITKDISFYSYRHSFATRLLKKGVPLITVSRLLGHQIISTTARFYSGYDTEQFKDAVKLLE
jgi:integrase/recombinase XerD